MDGLSTMKRVIVWKDPKGKVIACVEKHKVLRENLEEIQQICQDALEDAVLMGCDEQQFRTILLDLVHGLVNPYAAKVSESRINQAEQVEME